MLSGKSLHNYQPILIRPQFSELAQHKDFFAHAGIGKVNLEQRVNLNILALALNRVGISYQILHSPIT